MVSIGPESPEVPGNPLMIGKKGSGHHANA